VELLREAGCTQIDIGEMGGLLSLPASKNFERWGDERVSGQIRERGAPLR
jgi:hypothetical protein